MSHTTRLASWQPHTRLISSADLRDQIQQHDGLVIHFGSDWNLGSARAEETLAGVRSHFADRVTCVAIDIDEKAAYYWCRVCEIITIPTLVCFIRGRRQHNLVGEATPEAIVEWLNECLQKLDS